MQLPEGRCPLAEDIEEPAGEGLEGEVLAPARPAGLSHRQGALRVGQEGDDRLGEAAGSVPEVDIEARHSVEVDITTRVVPRGDDGEPVAHRLDVGDAEALLPARLDVKARARPERRHPRFGNMAEDVDGAARRRVGDDLAEAREPVTAARDHEARTGDRIHHRRPRGDGLDVTLVHGLPVELADDERDRRVRPGRGARGQGVGGARLRREETDARLRQRPVLRLEAAEGVGRIDEDEVGPLERLRPTGSEAVPPDLDTVHPERVGTARHGKARACEAGVVKDHARRASRLERERRDEPGAASRGRMDRDARDSLAARIERGEDPHPLPRLGKGQRREPCNARDTPCPRRRAACREKSGAAGTEGPHRFVPCHAPPRRRLAAATSDALWLPTWPINCISDCIVAGQAETVLRLAVITKHPVQYHAPLFRELARRSDLTVFFAHRPDPALQGAGFGTSFQWDVDLVGGYPHVFLRNAARRPDTGRFAGCDTPEIGERLAGGRFDAVLALGWNVKSLLQGIIAAKRHRMPVLVRGDSQLGLARGWPKRVAKAIAYPALLRAFDAALAVGTRNRAFYRRYGYPEARIFPSPHAVDTSFFAGRATAGAAAEVRARAGIAPGSKVLLFAGKLVDFKRPLDVVEAGARLAREGRNVAVMVAGAGGLADAMAARAAELGVPLHPLGFVNQTGMPAVYAAADVLVLPSTARETWGLVVNEALASGTPVVVSEAAGCAPDLAPARPRDRGAPGRSFPPGDIGALATALTSVLDHPPRRCAVAALAGGHTIARAADGILAALNDATARRAR